VAIRYALFQLPGLALVAMGAAVAQAAFEVPGWLAWGVVAGWAALDVALFPVVRIAYEPQPGGGGAAALVGARGVARDRLDPVGYVRIGAELWRAELAPGSPSVAAGAPIRVLAVEGLTLRVEPDRPGDRGAAGAPR